MSLIVDMLSGGAAGALFGGIQRGVETYQTGKQKLAEYQHIENMHVLQNKQDLLMADKELLGEQARQDGENLRGSYEHDASFKPHTWVDDIRALVRPSITYVLLWMAWNNPPDFLGLASACVLWWFASRVNVPGTGPVN